MLNSRDLNYKSRSFYRAQSYSMNLLNKWNNKNSSLNRTWVNKDNQLMTMLPKKKCPQRIVSRLPNRKNWRHWVLRKRKHISKTVNWQISNTSKKSLHSNNMRRSLDLIIKHLRLKIIINQMILKDLVNSMVVNFNKIQDTVILTWEEIMNRHCVQMRTTLCFDKMTSWAQFQSRMIHYLHQQKFNVILCRNSNPRNCVDTTILRLILLQLLEHTKGNVSKQRTIKI